MVDVRSMFGKRAKIGAVDIEEQILIVEDDISAPDKNYADRDGIHPMFDAISSIRGGPKSEVMTNKNDDAVSSSIAPSSFPP